MGWVKLTELNDRPCLGVRFTYDEVQDIDNNGNYNFSRQEDVKDPAFGTWGSAFRFDTTAKNVCDPAVNDGADVKYTPTADGQYNQVTVSDGVVEWMWSEPVYYWGFGSRDAVEDSFDPTPYAADYIYVLVDDGNDDGGDDGGNGGNTDAVTIADNLNRIIQAKADIKSAIEGKGVVVGDGTIDTYANKIKEIVKQGKLQVKNDIIYTNNTITTIVADKDYSGLEKVNVETRIPIQDTKTLDVVDNGSYSVAVDDGFEGLKRVNIDVNIPLEKGESRTFNTNGTYDINPFNGYKAIEHTKITVDVPQIAQKWVVPENTKLGNSSWETFDAESLDVSNMKTLYRFFYNCFYLTSIDLSSWNISNITSLHNMFQGCESLEVVDTTGWITSSVKSLRSMFEGCEFLNKVIGIEDWDVSNVTSINDLFYNTVITDLDLSKWNTSKVTTVLRTFCNAGLDNLNISSWDFNKVTDATYFLTRNQYLTNLQFGYNLKVDLDLSDNPQLTVDSLLSVINGLYNFTEAGQIPTSSQGKLTLGSTNLAKLTDNQKAMATNKGWVLS